ncbi:hypothetical protein E2562_000128 [Oryza meyeriana var. granulata]|uniref:Uncharacterized protein n=1 Tax=Oryza meyeriana var. granulata TaxID=110450 RepID=A0A6G1DBQ9_9ORYZ|nr:hypothetical protein E2562_000128 [Oryza meyeriana var. granulata]
MRQQTRRQGLTHGNLHILPDVWLLYLLDSAHGAMKFMEMCKMNPTSDERPQCCSFFFHRWLWPTICTPEGCHGQQGKPFHRECKEPKLF